MDDSAIEEFAISLIRKVRDQSIVNIDVNLSDKAKYPEAKKWKEIFNNDLEIDKLRYIVPDIVDEVIGVLLLAIDEGSLKLEFLHGESDKLERVNLNKQGGGEMAGWYLGDESWREKFSNERFNKY